MASHNNVEPPGAGPVEVHRVASNLVTVRDEAQSLRERRLALEAVMREERTRRLQASAARKAERTAPPTPADGVHPRSAAASSGAAPSPERGTNGAPQTLKEYRRELDNDNGSKEVFRLHYYSSAHLDPADVHFYAVKARVTEYQRHAPRPVPRTSRAQPSPSAQQRRSSSASRKLPPPSPAAAAGPATEGSAEPWTRAALLRMEANQQVLRRIEARERKEAAYAAGPQARTSAAAPATHGGVPAVVSVAGRADAASVTPVAAVSAIPAAREVPRSLAADRSYDVSAPASRWSPLATQRSPPRARFGESPLPLRTQASPGQPHSRFEPSIVYGSSSRHRASHAGAAANGSDWRHATATPWRPQQDGWATRLSADSVPYRPVVEQAAVPALDSKLHRPWAEQTQWRRPLPRQPSPPPQQQQHRSPLHSASAPAAHSAFPSGVAAERAEVEVSPLTPSPKLRSAHRGAAADAHVADATPSAKPSLLEGFRMPATVLKREDLFQGST